LSGYEIRKEDQKVRISGSWAKKILY